MGGFRCFIHPFLSLLRPQCFDGVGGRGAEAGEGDDQSRDEEHCQQRYHKHPHGYRRTVRKSAIVIVRNKVTDWCSNEETNAHNNHKLAVEHHQDLTHSGTVHTADTNLLAAVLRLENHQSQHTHQRNNNRQHREQRDRCRQLLLFLVVLAQFLVEEVDFHFLAAVVRQNLVGGCTDGIKHRLYICILNGTQREVWRREILSKHLRIVNVESKRVALLV